MFIRWGRKGEYSKWPSMCLQISSRTKFGTRLLFVNQFLTILMTHPFQLYVVFFIIVHPLLF
jgi:hyaluronan synthase